MEKPKLDEHHPYFLKYIDLVNSGDFYSLFEQNTKDVSSTFINIPKEKHNYTYAENKWTIKQVLMHIIDTERVFAYRALVAARGDSSPLPSFDENLYAQRIDVTNRSMESLVEEFTVIRKSTEILFKNITDEQSKYKGLANGYVTTARALAYAMMGHAQHHINIIKERYLA